MSITAQQFYDLVALCFAWRWDPDRLLTQYGSINSANWLLAWLGVYDENVRKIFSRDSNVAHLFAHRNDVMHVSRVPWDLEDEVWSGTTHFIIGVEPTSTYNPKRLLGKNGYLMVMTDVGQQYAMGIAPQYAELITKERFEEARRDKAEFFRATYSRRRPPESAVVSAIEPEGAAIESEEPVAETEESAAEAEE